MSEKKLTGTLKKTEMVLPDLKNIKADKDGYKTVTSIFDSVFYRPEKEGDVLEGEAVEILQAGKKGEERDAILIKTLKTKEKFLCGQSQIVRAFLTYGPAFYHITFKGKKKIKGGKTVNEFIIKVKNLTK